MQRVKQVIINVVVWLLLALATFAILWYGTGERVWSAGEVKAEQADDYWQALEQDK